MNKKPNNDSFMPAKRIESRIYRIRGKNVMLNHDLAKLYGVAVKVLNQAVKRNPERFPEDFMFHLTKEETQNWRSQFVTSNLSLKMGLRRCPYAFTEHGVAMLSSVLNSRTAIRVHIEIIRTFVRLKDEIVTYQDLWLKVCELEKKYDSQFQVVFKAIKLLIDKPKDDERRRF